MRLAAVFRCIPGWLLPLLLVWWLPVAINFGPAMLPARTFAFRDAAHYYPPLLRTIQRQWPENLPLWNPLEERGRPLWADPTAAVLYPGQLIFALPCPFAAAYKLYIVGHVLLCGLTCLVAARRMRLDWHAAALASVSYALGGSIVFQYCNPPYLIGAAWLPLGAAAVLGVIQGRTWRAGAELVAVLVLMVLGGDPQTAYLLGVASVLAAALAVWPIGRELGWQAVPAPLTSILGRLALVGALAGGISAAQWMPTLAWAAASERIERTPDRSVDAVTVSDRTHHDQARSQFSIGPWRWTELFWPNASGRLFPRHERWIRVIPAEGRTWAPSLYMGIVPLLLAGRKLRLRRGRLAERWLTCLVLLGVFGSLGHYGLGWLWAEISHGWSRPERLVPSGASGLYWLLTIVLPGFDLFRYPAKLWTWAALGLSLLAAQQLHDATAQQRAAVPRRGLVIYASVTLLMLLLLVALRPWVIALMSMAPPDALFGPLAVSSAYVHLLISLLQGLLVALLTLTILRAGHEDETSRVMPQLRMWLRRPGPRLAWALVTITALDLTIANQWMVATAPATAASAPGISALDLAQLDERPLLARSGTWYPYSWAQNSSDDRLGESIAWDSLTARPKYPMLHDMATLQGSTSFSSREQRALMELLDELSVHDRQNFSTLLRQLGVDFVCSPHGLHFNQMVPAGDGRRMRPVANDARWSTIVQPMPRAWIVHRAVPLAPPTTESTADLKDYLRDVFLPDGQPRDLRRELVLVTAEAASQRPDAVPHMREAERAHASECRVEEFGASSLRVEASLSRAGWLVVNESFDASWRAVVRSGGAHRAVDVQRGNHLMRAIPLPAGRHIVTLTYDPASVRRGLWVSAISLLLCAFAALRVFLMGRRSELRV